jgi:hypothetical protein
MEFKYVPEPYFSEIINYVRQRKEHIQLYTNHAEVSLGNTCSCQPQCRTLRIIASSAIILSTDPHGLGSSVPKCWCHKDHASVLHGAQASASPACQPGQLGVLST